MSNIIVQIFYSEFFLKVWKKAYGGVTIYVNKTNSIPEKHMKIAVITGAGSGMGKELAVQLSKKEQFDEMWVIGRREDKLKALSAEVSCPVRPIPLDLTASASFDIYKELLEKEKPTVSVLANCSGFGKFGTYKDIPLSESLNMIDLNCKALVAMTELTLPYMKKGSKIAQLDSLSSFQPVPYLNVYAASKAFVLSYSRALNKELKDRGIKVLAICPGWVKTDFFDRATVTDKNAVTYFNVMYEAKDVIKTAIKDLYKGKKDVSIHGFQVKAQVFLVKLLPHSFVMKTWLKQQKH